MIPPYDPYDHLDGTGLQNAAEIRQRVGDKEPKDSVGIMGADVAKRLVDVPNGTKKHPHTYRGGGRALPVPSDSDLDPQWNTPQPPPTEDEQTRFAKGKALWDHMRVFQASPGYKELSPEEKARADEEETARYHKIIDNPPRG